MTDGQQSNPRDQQPVSLGALFGFFLKLGCLAFGGPAAHNAMMKDELVGLVPGDDRIHLTPVTTASTIAVSLSFEAIAMVIKDQKWRGHKMARGIAHRLLKVDRVGRLLCASAATMGLQNLSKRASRHSGYVPRWVAFSVPSSDGIQRAAMISSADGSDQIARAIWVNGLWGYESPLPAIFTCLVRGARTVLDVGANSGLYAILAATAEPNCKVFSFEPFPEALKWLKTNLRANHLEDRVLVVDAAAGDTPGMSRLFIPEKQSANALETSASLVQTFRQKHSAVIDIRVETLDDYVTRNNISCVDVLRADVEGAEHLVLQGATRILKEHRPFCFVEVLADITATYLERTRSRLDYGVFSLGRNSLTPLAEVRCVFGQFNQLWYPLEKREKVPQLADELKLHLTAQ